LSWLSRQLGQGAEIATGIEGTEINAYPLVMSNIAIENDPVEIVDFPIEHGDFLYSYVSLPEGNFIILA